MVGDPPNIIIGTALQRYLGFVDFIIHLAPGETLMVLKCCDRPPLWRPAVQHKLW
jgi:Na+/H+ antiporter NhaD/arsenite permease-like protein